MVQTLSDLHVGVVHVPLVGEMVQRGDVNLTHIVPSVATSNYPTITVRHIILCVSPTLVNSVLQEVGFVIQYIYNYVLNSILQRIKNPADWAGFDKAFMGDNL